jgi:hypothetical protein
MNPSERYAFHLARRASLSLWSYATPMNGARRRELCNVLIMFPPNVAIISVKDIQLQGTSESQVTRWTRSTMEESAKQIYGAQRWIRSAPEYSKRKEANASSPVWDNLIERFSQDALQGNLEFGGLLSDTERALRQMASEDR